MFVPKHSIEIHTMAAIELSATTGGLTTNNIPVSLSNPVVLINVFNHLDAAVRGISEPSSKTDLLSAALACRAFCDPALDIVWKSLHTFVPLLKLLPPIGLTNNFYVSVIIWAVATILNSDF